MSASDKKSALLGQMSALACFMYVDGRDAFALLLDNTQAELRALFDALNGELQELIVEGRQ